MNLETKIAIYKFTPQLFTLTHNISDSSKLCSECFNFSDCPDKYFLPAILGRMTARTYIKKEMCQFRHISSIYTK